LFLLTDKSMSITSLPVVMSHRKPSLNVAHKHKQNYFSCKFCDKTFAWKNSLQTHVSNIHGESRGPFPCPLCGKLSKNKKSLTTHIHDFHRNWFTLVQAEPNTCCSRQDSAVVSQGNSNVSSELLQSEILLILWSIFPR